MLYYFVKGHMGSHSDLYSRCEYTLKESMQRVPLLRIGGFLTPPIQVHKTKEPLPYGLGGYESGSGYQQGHHCSETLFIFLALQTGGQCSHSWLAFVPCKCLPQYSLASCWVPISKGPSLLTPPIILD